ncbi:MAG: hypothetical protein ACHQET_10775 [Chitinophagales bacterium]
MKKSLIFIFSSMVLFACNSETPKQEEAKTDTTATAAAKKETLTYPFTPRYTMNWQAGDEKNAVLVLNSFKKYLDGDVKGAFADFADPMEFIGDNFYYKGKKDSLEAMMTPMRANYASMSFVPDTWITAYYPDSNVTWVTVWGVQKWTDKKGKTDSTYITDDVEVKNGKIMQIDEKERHYPKAKAKK